jgi:hypothetical protein
VGLLLIILEEKYLHMIVQNEPSSDIRGTPETEEPVEEDEKTEEPEDSVVKDKPEEEPEQPED